MQNTLTICNVSTSAMVRECKLNYITRAGVEIGVASTKAFTTQLTALCLLTLALAQTKGCLSDEREAELRSEEHTSELQSLMRISYAVFCLKKKKQEHITQKV